MNVFFDPDPSPSTGTFVAMPPQKTLIELWKN